MNGELHKVTISNAAKQLCLTEQSILTLVQFHRIGTERIEGELHAKDEDIQYFCNYLAEHGKLPDLPIEALNQVERA